MKLEISTQDHDGFEYTQKVKATLIPDTGGCFAYHEDAYDHDMFSVSHIRTGYRLFSVRRSEDAKVAGAVFWQLLSDESRETICNSENPVDIQKIKSPLAIKFVNFLQRMYD